MATKIGPVDIRLRLDTSEAERQIQGLQRKAVTARRPGSVVAEPPVPPVRGEKRSLATTRIAPSAPTREGQRFTDRIATGVLERARGGLPTSRTAALAQGAAGAIAVGGKRAGLAKGSTIANVAKTAAKIVASLLIGAATTKTLPEAHAAGRALLREREPGVFPTEGLEGDIAKGLEAAAQFVTEIEQEVPSAIEGIVRAKAFASAAHRITGQMPRDMYRYMRMFKDVAFQEQLLEEKFSRWQAREAPMIGSRLTPEAVRIVGESMWAAISKALWR